MTLSATLSMNTLAGALGRNDLRGILGAALNELRRKAYARGMRIVSVEQMRDEGEHTTIRAHCEPILDAPQGWDADGAPTSEWPT